MTRQYFGTDGIRGTVGQPPITLDFVLRLGHAVIAERRQRGGLAISFRVAARRPADLHRLIHAVFE